MGSTILLIDEAQLERKINEWTLMRAGYDVITAKTGEQGLRLARERAPDVILLDPILPDMSGHELIHSLQSDSRTARIPLIIVSTNPQLRSTCFKQEGAAEYLQKEQVLADNGRLLLDTVESVLHPVV
jgi:twitching motility two-component system response regulator PilH